MKQNIRNKTSAKLTLVSLLATVWICSASAGQPTQDHKHGKKDATISAAQAYFTDIELINQDGKKVRLYSDLIQNKVVVISGFFTSCENACSVTARTFQKIQGVLGERLGNEVHLISLTLDPKVDTPDTLKDYAGKLNAKPGWYFLTGEKEKLELALKKLGQFVDDKESHQAVIIIGNEKTGLWKKAFALANPDEIIKVVMSVVNDKS